MNGKTAKGAASKERMIDAAIVLMRHSGLAGAGINEIVKHSRAPKGSVYHFFPDGKQQIATEALTVYAERLRAVLEQGLARGDTAGARVRSLFRLWERRLQDGDFRQSCAAGAVCLDLDADLDAVRQVIEATFEGWIDVIAARLPFADRRRARSFAGLVLTAIEGGGIRGRAERSTRAFREAGAWLGELADREPAAG